jgi:prephenate dehydratase
MEVYTKVLYSMLFELSRGYQSQRNAARTDLFGRITEAIENTDKMLPKNAAVASLSDANGTNAMVCRKLFGDCPTVPFKTVDGILASVTQGLCRYGVIPVEGNVHKIYDQLASQNLTIMRSFRLSEQSAFICVSRQLEIYPGSHRTSLCLALSDKPGALYKVLARLYTLGINVVRLESRAMERRHFQGMFYFDLETSVYSEEFVQLICELGDLCEEFSYLGSYTEVV